MLQEKYELMNLAGCDEEDYVVLYDRKPSSLLCAARIASMTRQELTDHNLRRNIVGDRPVNSRNEKAAWRTIEQLAKKQLARYPTTIEVQALVC